MVTQLPLLWIFWDPNPDIFMIPYLNHPLRWYGVLFSLGLMLACVLFVPLLKQHLRLHGKLKEQEVNQLVYPYLDKLVWFAVIGIVVGARLGHVFFYDWAHYQKHLMDIPKVWMGGLASHGGVVGLLIALWLYVLWQKKTYPDISFLNLCDLLAIPATFTATCIRIGNFINQEIIGSPSTLPWAVLFGSPAEHMSAVPRHPVQLYEALAYFLTFVILALVWKARQGKFPAGMMIGLLFIFIFGARFVIEFVKQPMTSIFDQSFIQTGQILSIPFILVGLYLVFRNKSSPSKGSKSSKTKASKKRLKKTV